MMFPPVAVAGLSLDGCQVGGRDGRRMMEQASAPKQLDPSHIMQVGLGFWASKTLLAATKLGLFTLLDQGARTSEQIRTSLGLHGRTLLDFLDALLSLGFLVREGAGLGAKYQNTPETGAFLVKGKPQYIGGVFAMGNDLESRFSGGLGGGVRTGRPQN